MGNEVMSAGQLLKQANQLKRAGRLDEAIALYHQAIELNPNFAWTYNNLGDAFVRQAKLDEAVVEYRRAIEVNPNSAWFYINLGRLFIQQGSLDEAINYFRQAIQVKHNLLYELNGKYFQLFHSKFQKESFSFCLSEDKDCIELTEEPRWVTLPVKPLTSYYLTGQSCSEQPPAYNQGLVQVEFLDKDRKLIPGPYSTISTSKKIGNYIEISTSGQHLSEFQTNPFDTNHDTYYLRFGFTIWHNKKQIILYSNLKLMFELVVPLLEKSNHHHHNIQTNLSQSLVNYGDLKNINEVVNLLHQVNHILPNCYGVYDTLGDIFLAREELSQAIIAYRQCSFVNPNYYLPYHKLRQSYNINNLNGWSISEDLFLYILETLPIGSTILELGSGTGTLELSKYYNMVSIEHNQDWLNKYNSHYIYAPLVNDLWYDGDILRWELQNIDYHLLLVDGPPQHRRKGILNYLNLFNWNVPIILDDVNRKFDMNVAISLAKYLGKIPTVYKKDKSFAVIR